MTGRVYLVGAGPGDPELLTLKGRTALEQATVVLYDNLASPELLQFARPQARRIYVGKKRADHSVPQVEITRLMVEHALAGEVVVRLKGGDPYIFGRGGEEVEALVDAQLPFEVVPGVTAALGMAAYTGVPLTHREHTSSVTFVTGHEPDKIDWTKIGHAETLVIYMGLKTIGVIAERLIAAGKSPQTPALIVRRATTPKQQTMHATLGTLERAVEEAQLKPPTTFLIGEVAALGTKLDWFERRPLHHQTIVVTRAESQAGEGVRRLRALGAHVLEIPLIEILPPLDPAPLSQAVRSLDRYSWIVFTSANAVRRFFSALQEAQLDTRAVRASIAAIGAMTASALSEYGVKADRVANDSFAEGVVALFAGEKVEGRRFLMPRAASGRDVVPNALRERGAIVDVVEAYRTGLPPASGPVLEAVDHADWITFTSPSTVKNFLALGGRRLVDSGAMPVSIGPATSEALRAHGISQLREAARQTFDGMIEVMLAG